MESESKEPSFSLKSDSWEFTSNDLESLQGANIKQDLLDNHFVNKSSKIDDQMAYLIEKHSKIYGYVRINKAQFYRQKLDRLMQENPESSEIEDLKAKIERYEKVLNTSTMRQKRNSVALFTQANAIDQNIQKIENTITRVGEPRPRLREMQSLRRKSTFLVSGNVHLHGLKQDGYLLSRDIDKFEDHFFFDNLYEKNLTLLYDSMHRHDAWKPLKIGKGDKAIHTKQLGPKTIQKESVSSYTLSQDSIFFKIWNILILLVCLITTVWYPIFIILGFPETNQDQLWGLQGLEVFFAIEIFLNFFTQELDEEGMSKAEPLEKIAHRYFSTSFLVDLIALVPWGYFFSLIDPRFKFLWAIKSIRISTLNHYLSNKMILPPINSLILYRQENSLKSEDLKYQMDQDCVFISFKIAAINIVKTVRLIIQSIFVVFLGGTYWYVFVQTLHSFAHLTEGGDEVDFFGHYEENWDIQSQSSSRKITISMYFAFTTLSTVGFGDYYPVTDIERLIGSFFLLSGVSVFSFIMSELTEMILLIESTNRDFNEEDQLEKFFQTLRNFNQGRPYNENIFHEITTFLKEKWSHDKNNFLLTEEDREMFNQLPSDVKTKIYSEFLFKDFLFDFRRFFYFKKKDFNEKKKKKLNAMNSTSRPRYIPPQKNAIIEKFQNRVRTVINMHKFQNLVKDQFEASRGSNEIGKDYCTPEERQQYLEDKRMTFLTEQNQRRKETYKIVKLIEEIKQQKQKRLRENKAKLNHFSVFPFYTFEDDHYADFMVKMMQMLELRRYSPRGIVCSELEECNEIFFVCKGKYNIGYEVNKKKLFRRQFGKCTAIGGFQLTFCKRHQFIIRASTEMTGFAIRRSNWIVLIEQNETFKFEIKRKVLMFFFREIFRPLSSLKLKDIERFQRRRDFDQVLATNNDYDDEMKKFYTLIMNYEKQKIKSMLSEQSKLIWLVSRIMVKFDTIAELALSITTRTEQLNQILADRFIDWLLVTHQRHPKELIDEVYSQIYTFKEILRHKQIQVNTVESLKLNKNLQKLFHSLHPKTNFQWILKDTRLIGQFKQIQQFDMLGYTRSILLKTDSMKKKKPILKKMETKVNIRSMPPGISPPSKKIIKQLSKRHSINNNISKNDGLDVPSSYTKVVSFSPVGGQTDTLRIKLDEDVDPSPITREEVAKISEIEEEKKDEDSLSVISIRSNGGQDPEYSSTLSPTRFGRLTDKSRNIEMKARRINFSIRGSKRSCSKYSKDSLDTPSDSQAKSSSEEVSSSSDSSSVMNGEEPFGVPIPVKEMFQVVNLDEDSKKNQPPPMGPLTKALFLQAAKERNRERRRSQRLSKMINAHTRKAIEAQGADDEGKHEGPDNHLPSLPSANAIDL